MGNSLQQYRIVIGMHCNYLKARESRKCFTGRFWSCLVLLFLHGSNILTCFKNTCSSFWAYANQSPVAYPNISLQILHSWLIRLANDVQTNPGPNVDSATCMFTPCDEGSQKFMCSITNLPLAVKLCLKPSKPLGKPSNVIHILGDGNCLFWV